MTQVTNRTSAANRPMPAIFKQWERRFRRFKPHYEARFDPHWLALLDAENVHTVILDRRKDCDLLWLLYHSPDWVVDFADWRSVILVRRAAANMVQ